ncbi:hypothetical protein ACEYYB_04985 [Paracoccus sp. p4-l81]|uniref:hypothetical protein n=1 Tax=unclassified Paracoccus (in: a-proteobacteria) TaxID=2688777 RepID=UPI0035B6D24C
MSDPTPQNLDPHVPQPGRGLHLLIVESNSFVAQDMIAGFQDCAPGCQAEALPSLAALSERLVGHDAAAASGAADAQAAGRRLVLVISARPEDRRAAGIADKAREQDAVLVLVSGYAEDDLAEADHILPSPFAGDDLAALMAALID